jgi:hypothetical protein
MASWRFQGAKHHPNQNNSGSFRALSCSALISREQPLVGPKQVLLALHPAAPRVQVPARMTRFAAVRSG